MFNLCKNQVVGFYQQSVDDLHLYFKLTLPQVFFIHFASKNASKNQLPGLYVSRTLVENGLTSITSEIQKNWWCSAWFRF